MQVVVSMPSAHHSRRYPSQTTGETPTSPHTNICLENFLFGFIVPLLPYMIEHRLGLPPSSTQRTTTALLSTLGLISILAAPIIGHLADLAPSRKLPLLLSLAVGVAGTLLVATTISLPAIFAGRVLQGLSGTGAWIICFAMLTDAAGGKHLGKMLGFAGSFITGGIVIGPAAGGVLLQVVGYWPAWSVPLALLAIGLVARLCMIEEAPSPPMMKKDTATPSHSGEDVESAPLISDTTTTDSDENDDIKHRGASSRPNFYTVVLTQPKAWAAMFNVVAFALILSGFDATLPLHLRNTFGWKPAQIGSIFLGIQVPGMVLGPFIGWLRDSIGLRWPVTIGWLLTAPLLWFSGVPGRWEGVGQGAFVGCIIAVGVVMTLVRGAGTFALTSKFECGSHYHGTKRC